MRLAMQGPAAQHHRRHQPHRQQHPGNRRIRRRCRHLGRWKIHRELRRSIPRITENKISRQRTRGNRERINRGTTQSRLDGGILTFGRQFAELGSRMKGRNSEKEKNRKKERNLSKRSHTTRASSDRWESDASKFHATGWEFYATNPGTEWRAAFSGGAATPE